MAPPPLNRRQALAGFGAVSVGALLAACEGDSPSQTKTRQTATTSNGDLAGLFDETSSCTLTPS